MTIKKIIPKNFSQSLSNKKGPNFTSACFGRHPLQISGPYITEARVLNFPNVLARILWSFLRPPPRRDGPLS
jgi:hypothetical protein